MPIKGAGNQPAGLSPGGLGSPLGLPTPGAGFSKVFDVVDVRQISPLTHDFVVSKTTDGAPHGTMGANSQRVLIALSTPLGQIQCSPLTGDKTLRLGKMPTQQTAEAYTRLALKDMIDAGDIEIVSIQIERDPRGTLARVVQWVDTATRSTQTTRAGF